MLKRVVVSIAILLLLLIAVLAVNTVRHGSRQLNVPPAPPLAVDEAAAAERLAVAIRARTVSAPTDASVNADQFRLLHEHLRSAYPRVHATLKREEINGLSLLYTWPGSDPAAQPVLLLAHQDVVPIAPGTEGDWAVPPWSGLVKDGFVWGRGSWDDKGNLIAQLEAVEMLIASGFQPRRTIYLAFGADEEVGGLRGAAQIAKLLAERKVKLDFVLDEGLVITDGVLPGMPAPVALIGIAEKGYVSVNLRLQGAPGHSSMPPPKGSGVIAQTSAALVRIEEQQFPAALRGVAREMFDTIAPEMGGVQRVVLSNLWLFGPLVQRQLEAAASTNAMLRTTTALTVVRAGERENVMPGRAEAIINFRILQGDSIASVVEHVKRAAGDGRFEVSAAGGNEPSRLSPTTSSSYALINRTVREVFPGTLVAPGLMIAGTDSKHFEGISDHVYRFSPVRAKPQDLPRFHGTDERLGAANLAEMVRFYHRLLGQGAGRQEPG